jgi:hypothetical protein
METLGRAACTIVVGVLLLSVADVAFYLVTGANSSWATAFYYMAGIIFGCAQEVIWFTTNSASDHQR